MADDKKMYFKNKAENIFIDDNTNVKTALDDKASKNHTHRTALSLIPTGTNIPENADLNTIDYIKVGCYYCRDNNTANTFKNCPTNRAFMMEVYSPISKTYDNESTSKWTFRIRKIMTYDGHIFIQMVESGATAGVFTYHPWYKIYSEYDKPSIGNGTIKIKQNGNEKGVFTVNQSGNTTIDLGTVLTGGKQTTTSSEDGGSNIYTFSDNSTITIKNGSKGSAGKDGTSAAWFTGTVVTGTSTTPTSFTVSGSKTGDMYINTSTYNIYKATAANSWIYVCNIKGTKGDPGTNGITPTIKAASGANINTVGVPTVTATTSGTTTTFTFDKLKGAKGDKGDPGVNATTTATGTANTAGLTKLYASTGTNTDGTITQAALKSALDGKSPTDHTHNYAGSASAGGSALSSLMIRDGAVADASNPADNKNIIISYNSTLTSADYIAAWGSSGAAINKISSSKINAGKVNGHTVNSDVPSNAKFTDTTYPVATTSTAGLMSAKDKITVNNTYSILADNVDWNTLITTGIYHVKTQAGTNRPTTNWGTLYVNGDGTVFQIWIPDVSLTSIYKRYKSGSWSDWAELKLTDHCEKYNVLTSANFNTFTGRSDGIVEYFTGTFGIAAGNLDDFTNCPEIPNGRPSVLVFTLKVYKGVTGMPTSYDVTWQEYTNIFTGKQYMRYYKDSKWSDWLERNGDDTGWINISSFGTNVKGFSSTTPCRFRRIGKTVQVNAVFGVSANLGTGIVTLAKLGPGYGPSAELCTVQNGVGTYRWLCTMKTDGSITAQLYSNGSNAVSIPSGAYLHCNFVYNI